MDTVSIQPFGNIGKEFVPAQFLPAGKDEYYIRNQQQSRPADQWRNLNSDEIERLVKNGNSSNNSNNWDSVLVTNEFDPQLIRNSEFFGLVRIGRLNQNILQHHNLQMPTGISNSRIISCDIGDDTAIHNVKYLAHCIVGNRCILANIDEMHTSNHAKFGNCILKDGESEEVRIQLNLMNETSSRSILAFDGMTTADAYLWAKYRDDTKMLERFKHLTQELFDSRRGYYGTIGDQSVIKNSRIIKDVKVGAHCYIKGVNKLKNLTINSTEAEPTQIGEGVELVNGIIGTGCSIFYGCKAVRFVLGDNSNLKYGARLIHSYLGDNSTISCCEVLNNLIFPAHEQHHNNSFLIASVVKGQSNLAAGATIGSNHNSRANDNEIQAGRGFWPGLCTTIKHSSRFASFILMAKGRYSAELDIQLPFSLLNNNVAKDRLEISPAFWWQYNMYALARNSKKYQSRDTRVRKTQNIEFETFAPDSIEEAFTAMRLLEIWTGKASLRSMGKNAEVPDDEAASLGKELLVGPEEIVNNLEVLGENMEKSKRKSLIIKPHQGYNAYKQILLHYAIKNIIEYIQFNQTTDFDSLKNALTGQRHTEWENIGGQLIPTKDVDQLRADIGSGQLATWDDIHKRYDQLWRNYPLEKQKHAFATLCALYETEDLKKELFIDALNKSIEVQQYICDHVYISRKKDFDNPFRQATYRNAEEMKAAIGTIDENSFVIATQKETKQFNNTAKNIIESLT